MRKISNYKYPDKFCCQIEDNINYDNAPHTFSLMIALIAIVLSISAQTVILAILKLKLRLSFLVIYSKFAMLLMKFTNVLVNKFYVR